MKLKVKNKNSKISADLSMIMGNFVFYLIMFIIRFSCPLSLLFSEMVIKLQILYLHIKHSCRDKYSTAKLKRNPVP